MAENTEEIAVTEGQDGSATVDLPEGLVDVPESGEKPQVKQETNTDEDADHPDDNDELRQAKRNRRRAKKDLIRKTNVEKDARLVQLQRENEEFKRRLVSLEKNTRDGQMVRVDKAIEDAQVKIEYAKMKIQEATANQDGAAMVEAQEAFATARDEARNLLQYKQQYERQVQQQPQQEAPQVDPDIQRNAAEWVRRNSWYDPNGRDADSRVAKKIDELMVTQGWNPNDSDYWEELDARLQKELPHRYNDVHNDEQPSRKPRNSVGSAGREASASYGGSNRNQFVLSPERVSAMRQAGAWDNPERKAKMIKQFIEYDRKRGAR